MNNPTAFQTAARQGDLEKVKALLRDNPDLVFSKDNYGQTPLHYAAATAHKDVVELLLASKAEVNAMANDGDTPLHLAATEGHKDVVELLLASKAEVNAMANDGTKPLHLAAAEGHKDVVELLLVHGAEVNAKDNDGDTPMLCAAEKGHKDVAEFLRQHGGSPDAKDSIDQALSDARETCRQLRSATISRWEQAVEAYRARCGNTEVIRDIAKRIEEFKTRWAANPVPSPMDSHAGRPGGEKEEEEEEAFRIHRAISKFARNIPLLESTTESIKRLEMLLAASTDKARIATATEALPESTCRYTRTEECHRR